MKKSALALAIGAAFAAPAMAQTTVQIYGKMYPQLGYYKVLGREQPGGRDGHPSGSPAGDRQQ
jgi:predicted porin